MKSLLELYQESADMKLEINLLISESNDCDTALELKLSLLSEITLLHQRLNALLHEIRELRTDSLHIRQRRDLHFLRHIENNEQTEDR
jgi:hypothetical protein